jgi:transcriptional regulator with XRE-family HTH domain
VIAQVVGGFLSLPMETVGKKLRETREKLGLTLEEVERATKIRPRHLQALEEGDLASMTSPAQARGFLRNYADFLGLDVERIMLEYADSLQKNRKRRIIKSGIEAATTRPSVVVQKRRFGWFSMDLLVAAVITIAILAVLGWGISWAASAMRENHSDAQEASEFLIPTFTPVPSETIAPEGFEAAPAAAAEIQATLPPLIIEEEPSPTATLSLLVDLDSDLVNLQIVIERRAWLLVRIDGEDTFRGRVPAGNVLEFQGQELIEVTTGNAGGIRVIYNGNDLGPLGETNQVITLLWNLEGIITPTPSATPTATTSP